MPTSDEMIINKAEIIKRQIVLIRFLASKRVVK
jgi:hypothetical protein